MRFKKLICCECDAKISLGEEYYEINGRPYCIICGEDIETEDKYKMTADFPSELYEDNKI